MRLQMGEIQFNHDEPAVQLGTLECTLQEEVQTVHTQENSDYAHFGRCCITITNCKEGNILESHPATLAFYDL